MRSEVQILPGPPFSVVRVEHADTTCRWHVVNRKSRALCARAIPRSGSGGVAQLGERLLCKQEVIGSIPFTSTTSHEVAGCPALAGKDGDAKSGKDSFSRAPALGPCMRLFVIVNRFA